MIKALILGIVQGATEFLPVSSSAHLVFMQKFLNMPWNGAQAAAFDVALHLGTAFSVCAALRGDIVLLIKGLFSNRPEEITNKRTVGMIMLATIPAVFVALLFKEKIEALFVSPMFAGFALITTGIILFLTRLTKRGNLDGKTCKVWQVILVGCAQAVAIIPGISRSGSTISSGLFLKWDPVWAAKFSFLLSLPAILGAAVLEVRHLSGAAIPLSDVAGGFISSFIVGYACVRWMLKIVSKANLWMFAPYCWAVGFAIVVLIK